MKPMGGRTWKYWPASGPFFIPKIASRMSGMLVQNNKEKRLNKSWRYRNILGVAIGPTCIHIGRLERK